MSSKAFNSLFLQQSYNDAWVSYKDSISSLIPTWTHVIITASNEGQAEAYWLQINSRLSRGLLSASTHYAVLPDKDDQRIGSGGATLSAIKYIHDNISPSIAPDNPFKNQRILVIHSGGDSKRVPQYSACGKLFSPVPRLLPDGRRSTLFDEFIIGMSGVAGRISEGMLVCSGDVLLLFNPLQIDFYTNGAAALSIKERVETGKDHGVYLKGAESNVAAFLHKQTVQTLTTFGAVDNLGNVDIDTGAVILSTEILQSIYGLIDSDDQYNFLVNERTRLSFYADFLYPMASNSTLEQFYQEKPEGGYTDELHIARELLWQTLHPYSIKLIRLSPASFIHFGTSSELRNLMASGVDDYTYLGWKRNINSNYGSPDYAASNSYISSCAYIGRGSYIEDSYIHHDSAVGENCIISGVTLDGQTVPNNAVLHGLKLIDGRFVVRMYGVDDNPKECKWFGKMLSEPLWNTPIFTAHDSIKEAVESTLELCSEWIEDKIHGLVLLGAKERYSLKTSFNQADTAAIMTWQEHLNDKVKVESLLAAIDNREPNVTAVFNSIVSQRAEKMLIHETEKLDDSDLTQFGCKIRIFYALTKLTTNRDKYTSACFDTIRIAILRDAVAGLAYDHSNRISVDEVVERLPIRVNWGGGWSDTPPYCMEHGGTVLNSAATLNGKMPVEAVVRRIAVGKIVLASGDNGSYKEFTSIDELQDSSNPYDPFALHKATLVACGVIPYKDRISVQRVTEALGSGLFLSTQVTGIPRGSGLGTSSILAGACVKAIMKFLGKELPENELYSRVLCMEQIMSTGGGWQDQVGGLAPGIKMVTSNPGMHQSITCTPIVIPSDALDDLNNRFCLIYTGQRRLARNLLREVVGKYIASDPAVVEVLYEIQRKAVLMRFELEKGNVDGFASLLNEHWELSKRLDAGCTNTCIEQIFLTVNDMIDGKMICGAGGGGFLQVVLKKGVSREQLEERLHKVFQDSGARVWKCELA